MSSSGIPSAALPALAPKATDKSDKSEKQAADGSKAASRSKEKDEDGIGIEELAMPRTMIQRLARSALPPNTQLQKDTILALTKSATLFISHIAAYALEDLGPNKKTIMPNNVFAAIEETEFSFMIPMLKASLEKFVAIQTSKKEENKRKLKDGKGGPDGSTILVGDEDSIADGVVQTRGADPASQLEAESAIDRQRSAKRAKGLGGTVVTAGDDDDADDVDMTGADGQDDVAEEDEDEEEEELDEEATESENDSGDDETQEDRVGTDPEDEGEDEDEDGDTRTEEDSD